MADDTVARGVWTIDSYGCHWIYGAHCAIWMAPRPAYCDRGRWLAHVEVNSRDLNVDGQDMWPRYYFDLDRAKAEVEAWLRKRGEL
jgi:hypothetical protein